MNPQEIQKQREELKQAAVDWLVVTAQPIFLKYPIVQSFTFFSYQNESNQVYLCRDIDEILVNDESLDDWWANKDASLYELANAAANELVEIIEPLDKNFFWDTFGHEFYVTLTSTEITCKPYKH